jgi:RNA polymerase sigma factor (sigma-70 family)
VGRGRRPPGQGGGQDGRPTDLHGSVCCSGPGREGHTTRDPVRCTRGVRPTTAQIRVESEFRAWPARAARALWCPAVTERPARDDEATAALLRDVQAGVAGAWDRLVERYARLVLAVPREYGLTDADADEVFQSTWMALYEQVKLIRQPGALGSWIITTAQRQCWRVLRRAHRRRETTGLEAAAGLVSEGPAPHEVVERLERQALVRAALDELRPRCRALLTQLFLAVEAHGPVEAGGETSYARIARELDMPIGSIGPTRSRCLAELARKLAGRIEP